MKQTCWYDICTSDLTKAKNNISVQQILHHILFQHLLFRTYIIAKDYDYSFFSQLANVIPCIMIDMNHI